MKDHTQLNVIVRSNLALAFALVIWAPAQAQSTMPAKEKSMMESKTAVQMPATEPAKEPMMADGRMMESRQALMAEMKAQDVELTAQVAKMNSAPKDKKLDLLAAIVTRMVEQRTAMNARMETMQSEMKMPMQSGEEPMSTHPMMKGMDEKPKSATKGQE